jgi:hypothetical protein
MSEQPFYILKLERLQPGSSADDWLGRIVQMHDAPEANFTPKNPSRFHIDPPIETVVSDVSFFFQGNTNSQLSAKIAGIASASRSRDKADSFDFATSSITYKRLPNYPDVLDSMIEDDEVRKKLKRMMSRSMKPCFMIVGLGIWTDATFSGTQSQSRARAGSGTIPVSLVASAAAGSPITVPDPEVGGSGGSSVARTVKGISKGEHIFAFEYKTVRKRLFSHFANFNPKLGDHGPRVEGDRTFGTEDTTDEEESEAEGEEANTVLEMDEEDVLWIEMVDKPPIVEKFGKQLFAFDD